MIASGPLEAFTVLTGFSTPSPTPLPYNPDDVTPGVVGFLFTFVIFVLVGLIAWDLLRRVRNMRYRDEVRARLEAEVALPLGSETSGAEQAGRTGVASGASANDAASSTDAHPSREQDPKPDEGTAPDRGL